MRNVTLKMAVLGALSFISSQTYAAGFVSLPASPSGSAYINCYNANRVIPPTTADEVKGNFGSYPIPSTSQPSTTVNDTCFVAKPTFEATAPISGYTSVATRTTTLLGDAGNNIGTLVDRVWRNAANDTCIFGTRVTMINADHDSSTAGTQYFEVNDIARGGFGTGTVNVAYTIFSTTGNTSPLYRVGRTFTSVQHRSLAYDTLANKQQNGTGYLDLPTIGGSSTLNINGVNTPISATATASALASQQTAQVNSNWVDFTADTVFADDDGSTNALSGFTYIQASCNGTNPDAAAPNSWVKTGAIRLRQTAQEATTFKEIVIDGYAPPGATVP
jgi:hypothetical protein